MLSSRSVSVCAALTNSALTLFNFSIKLYCTGSQFSVKPREEVHEIYVLSLPKCNKAPREMLWYKFIVVLQSQQFPLKWVTLNGTKENGRYWTKARSSAVQSHEFCKYSPLLLGSSAGVHCSTSSGSKKSLFKTSMTCILLRLTRSTSFNFLSSCLTISLPDWLVKIVIWNTNHSATAASDSNPCW